MDFPIINDEFVTTWGSLALRNLLQSSHKFDGRFECERKRIVCLSLPVRVSITRPKYKQERWLCSRRDRIRRIGGTPCHLAER